MQTIQGKIWGSTSEIFNKNSVSVNRLKCKKGGTSSVHRHKSKKSLMYVEAGKIEIHVQKKDYNLTDITVLQAGESTIIPTEEYHKFVALEDNTIIYEIYWAELDSNDIERQVTSPAHIATI